uniref:Secreted protein n=1 Tax=Loa loa TaxID=7209 RepID=A0A1I7VUY7_LOALO
MWLYSVTILFAFTYLICSSNSLNAKKRFKQDGNHIATNHRRRNRLSTGDKEEIQIPMKIPKLSRAQKIALIIESGQNPFEKKQKRKGKGKKRSRKLRHVQRYPGNAYFLLDDTDGDDESQWNVNRYRENDNDDIQQQQQQQQQESNPRFENLNRETTTTSSEAKWGTVKESYDDHVNYWETTTSWYWNTTPKQSYQKK